MFPPWLGSAFSRADVLKFPGTKMGGAESCDSVHPIFIESFFSLAKCQTFESLFAVKGHVKWHVELVAIFLLFC